MASNQRMSIIHSYPVYKEAKELIHGTENSIYIDCR